MTLKTPLVLLKSDDLFGDDQSSTVYDQAREISRYLLMHYGQLDDVFDRPDHPLAGAHAFPQRLSELLRECAARTGTSVSRVLDVGCNVGGVSHAMSGWVQERVVGLDISERSIEIARSLSDNHGGVFNVAQLGPFTREIEINLPERQAAVEFRIGDAGELSVSAPAPAGGYDAVLLSNVLDRVSDPSACLAQFTESTDLLRSGGLLMIACPWSWYSQFSHPGRWLGSAEDQITSEQAVKDFLQRQFDLVMESNEPAVLRQNPREYDYFEAHVTTWLRH